MKIEFINKIWVKGTGKVSVLRKVLCICAVLLLLISFVQLLLGGLEEVSWFTGVVLPVVMLVYYRLNYNADGYMGVRCDFRIENDGFHVYYYDIDYHDGKGAHAEHINIPYENVKEFQYSRELVSVRIISQPVVISQVKGQELVTDYRTLGSVHTCILYLPAEKLDEMLRYMKENIPIPVIHMDH